MVVVVQAVLLVLSASPGAAGVLLALFLLQPHVVRVLEALPEAGGGGGLLLLAAAQLNDDGLGGVAARAKDDVGAADRQVLADLIAAKRFQQAFHLLHLRPFHVAPENY